VWQAHRKHYYQRLVLAGWGHRKTVLAEYMVMIAAGLSALVYQNQKESRQIRLTILIVWACFYLLTAYAVRRLERAHRLPNDVESISDRQVNL
jgi:hypothetical protein